MLKVTRRKLLQTGLAAAGATAAPWAFTPARAGAPVTELRAASRTLEVAGRSARVLGLRGPGGSAGLSLDYRDGFRVRLTNDLDQPTVVHWHGLTPPFEQDGVAEVSQPAIPAGESHGYDFALARHNVGTHWMHSHLGLQEQQLLAAPLIVRGPAEVREDRQEAVILLHDFSFRDPEELLADLVSGEGGGAPGGHGGQGGHGSAPSAHGTHGGHGATREMVHSNDLAFDAYLANDRTLEDPEVVSIEPGGRLLLRIINAASATGFWIETPGLNAELLAVDGRPVLPLKGSRFPLSMAQRIDLLLRLPPGRGAYPVLALREAARERSGILLATAGAPIAKLSSRGESEAPPLDLSLETRLRAGEPFTARAVDRKIVLELTGGTERYRWGIEGVQGPLVVRGGERIALTFRNRTAMAHPMHLHGHHFQVVEIEGRSLAGALRDTLLVPARGEVTVAFDANNPGRWLLHCHHLYHMVSGMMTTLVYDGFA